MPITGYVAAAAGHHASPGVLVLIGLGLFAAWFVSLLLWPNAPCTLCKGSGRNAGSSSRRWGSCRRCGGSGKRLRFGAGLARRAVSRRNKD